MKWKKFVSVLLIGGMATALLAGCGSGSSEEDLVGSLAEEEDTDYDEEEDEDDGEIVDIELYGLSMFGTDGLEEVQDAINEISEEEIGVHVNITLLDMGSYDQTINLQYSAQEEMDILLTMPGGSTGFTTLVSQNELLPLNDLLTEYAPELNDMMATYTTATTVNGNIYAIPVYRQYNSNSYIIMRADILEDLGLTEEAENISSWSEYEDIMQAVIDSGYDGDKVSTAVINTDVDGTVITQIYCMQGNDDWSENFGFDTLGDTYKIIAVDEDTDTVYDYYESEEYYKMLKLMQEWYQKGYVYADAATNQESGDIMVANDVAFSEVTISEFGVEASKLSATGHEVVCPLVTEVPISTGNAVQFTFGIPVTSKEPEAAAKFLNLMYTNEDIANLLVWGIEGRDYEVNDEGEAVKLDGVVYQANDFLWGNQFLAYPAEGQGGDFREVALENMNNAPISPYFGCAVDTSEISNELTAVYNVIQEYVPGYQAGSSPDLPDTYEEYYNGDFCTALRAAGVDAIVASYQSQLDAWMAEQ